MGLTQIYLVFVWYLVFLPGNCYCSEQRARMDVDEPTAKAVGGEILPMIFVVSKAIEYIKNQILDRVVSWLPSHTGVVPLEPRGS